MAALVADSELLPEIPPRDGRTCQTCRTGRTEFAQAKDPARSKASRKAEVAGNVMLCLINQETYLLGRQIARLAADFEQEGGFTERLHRIRTEIRKKGNHNR